MPAYAVGLASLLQLIETRHIDEADLLNGGDVKHAAYADDLGGAGLLESLQTWWNKVVHFGPLLGYYQKAKSWLVVKDEKFAVAKEMFADIDINTTSEGRRYLGGFIGTVESRGKYAKELVEI